MVVNRKRESLVLGYVHAGTVRHCFSKSMNSLIAFDIGHEHLLSDIVHTQGLYVHCNRNSVVEQFLSTDAEWFLSVDTDIQFEPMDVYNLLGTAIYKKVKILSGLYFNYVLGYPKLLPMWLMKKKEGLYSCVQRFGKGLNPIDAAGMGFCIVHRSVFEEMKKAYGPYKPSAIWFDHDPGLDAEENPVPMGEDICFFDRLGKIGIKSFGYSAVVVGHDKGRIVGLKEFLADHGQSTEEIIANVA